MHTLHFAYLSIIMLHGLLQDAMQWGGAAHSPARSDGFAHRGRTATARLTHGPGLPPPGPSHASALPPPMHGARAPAPVCPAALLHSDDMQNPHCKHSETGVMWHLKNRKPAQAILCHPCRFGCW